MTSRAIMAKKSKPTGPPKFAVGDHHEDCFHCQHFSNRCPDSHATTCLTFQSFPHVLKCCLLQTCRDGILPSMWTFDLRTCCPSLSTVLYPMLAIYCPLLKVSFTSSAFKAFNAFTQSLRIMSNACFDAAVSPVQSSMNLPAFLRKLLRKPCFYENKRWSKRYSQTPNRQSIS